MTPQRALKLMEADGIPEVRQTLETDAGWEVSQSAAAWLDAKGVRNLVVYVTRAPGDDAECVRLKLIQSDDEWSSRDIRV